MNYKNFTLELSSLPLPEGYEAKNLNLYQLNLNSELAVGNFPSVTASLVLTPPEIAKFYDEIRGVRVYAADPETFKKFRYDLTDATDIGKKLFKFIFEHTGNYTQALDRALVEAQKEGVGLRFCLKMWGPEINNLPWEYLFQDVDQGRFFASDPETPIVRYITRNSAQPNVAPPDELRIVAIVGADLPGKPPRQAKWLDALEELKKIVLKLQPQAIFDILQPQTADEFRFTLREISPFHILHYFGHGRFDADRQMGCLVFPGGDVYSDELDLLLKPQKQLKLVVLDACYSAQTGLQDRFSSVATGLSRVPAVVAMQFDVLQGAAIELSNNLYHALACGFSLEEAVAEARKVIWLKFMRSEFGVPVLYTRTEAPIYLFHPPAKLTPPPPPPPQLDTAAEALAPALAAQYQKLGEALLNSDSISAQSVEQIHKELALILEMLAKGQALRETLTQSPRQQQHEELTARQTELATLPTKGTRRGGKQTKARLVQNIAVQNTRLTVLGQGLDDDWGEVKPDYTNFGEADYWQWPPQTLLSRAVAEFNKKDNLLLAVQYLQQAQARSPRNGKISFWLGKVYFVQRRYDEAREQFMRALNISSSHPEVYLEIAGVCAIQGASEEQLNHLNRAVELQPNNPKCRLGRASFYYNMKEYVEAAADFEEALKHKITPTSVYFMLGDCYYLQNPPSLNKALTAYDTFLSSVTDTSHPLYQQALSRLEEIGAELNESLPDNAA